VKERMYEKEYQENQQEKGRHHHKMKCKKPGEEEMKCYPLEQQQEESTEKDVRESRE